MTILRLTPAKYTVVMTFQTVETVRAGQSGSGTGAVTSYSSQRHHQVSVGGYHVSHSQEPIAALLDGMHSVPRSIAASHSSSSSK